MTITYLNTLYNKEVTMLVVGSIEFKNNGVEFASGGHGYFILTEYVRKIEA